MHIYFHLKNLHLKCLRKKNKTTSKYLLSCNWKWNFRRGQPASSTADEALLEGGNKILETASAIKIFTSHSDENENTSPPRYIFWQHKTDIYYHLLQISHIILLCYCALWTSDPSTFNRSITEMWSRNQESSDSCQCCRMDMKEKEKSLCETTAQEGLLIAKLCWLCKGASHTTTVFPPHQKVRSISIQLCQLI